MKIKGITLAQAEYTAYRLAKEVLVYDEPMPPFATRFPGKLEVCLKQPFHYFSGQPLYRFIYQRGAILFYCVIKNHPFLNGNKRMAVTITMVFFYVNKKWITVNPHDLYQIACKVAESKPAERDIHITALSKFFKNNMVKL